MHRPPVPPRKYSWYSFLLQAESTPGPYCGRKVYMSEKFQWLHRETDARIGAVYEIKIVIYVFGLLKHRGIYHCCTVYKLWIFPHTVYLRVSYDFKGEQGLYVYHWLVVANLFRATLLCALFVQNENKMHHSNTALVQQEYYFHIAPCFDPHWIIIGPSNTTINP